MLRGLKILPASWFVKLCDSFGFFLRLVRQVAGGPETKTHLYIHQSYQLKPIGTWPLYLRDLLERTAGGPGAHPFSSAQANEVCISDPDGHWPAVQEQSVKEQHE